MSRSSLVRYRDLAYIRQGGCCHYCGLPMWLNDRVGFASTFQLTLRQINSLQCTGEHLIARQNGGGESEANIVAACLRCNLLRHRRKNPHSAEDYKLLVQKRMGQGRWHCRAVMQRFADLVPARGVRKSDRAAKVCHTRLYVVDSSTVLAGFQL